MQVVLKCLPLPPLFCLVVYLGDKYLIEYSLFLLKLIVPLFYSLVLLRRCYGNASTRKRLNTEMPQKKAETPQKPVF